MSATAGEAASGAFKVNSLSGLEEADAGSGHLVWDWPRSIWNMSFLAAALVLGPLYFTWSAFAVFLILSGVTLCVGHSVGFHRRLIHHTFDCPKWLERTMVYIGVLVGMGGRYGPWACTTSATGHSGRTTVTGSCATPSRRWQTASTISTFG